MTGCCVAHAASPRASFTWILSAIMADLSTAQIVNIRNFLALLQRPEVSKLVARAGIAPQRLAATVRKEVNRFDDQPRDASQPRCKECRAILKDEDGRGSKRCRACVRSHR